MNNMSLNELLSTLSNFEHLEYADYLEMGQEQLYFVLHPTLLPLRSRVILAGPFASERPHRYISWVRWARFLASHGYEVMRFDYRGVGESTGQFENFGFRNWLDDLDFCANWLNKHAPSAPLVIHGLGMGALLGQRLFEQGTGNALLSWLPPKSAREMLYEQLKIKLANNFILPSNERKTRDQFVADLENGIVVEVEGHNWTQQLWTESAEFEFNDVLKPERNLDRIIRPHHVEQLDALAAHTFGGVGPNPLRMSGSGKPVMRLINPDLTICFDAAIGWMEEVLPLLKAS